VAPGQNAHYTSVIVRNKGDVDQEICGGWHNTLGAPLLSQGCVISGCANRWTTAPKGGEFDATTRLELGAEFDSLKAAPLAGGGTVDISKVPSMIGYTDFACGPVPKHARLGWESLVNPHLKLAYVTFFTGPAAAAGDDLILHFNELWMQYGGRRFVPWAPCNGGTDITYCLGTENATSAYAYGLEYSRQKKELLGAPTTFVIPANGAKVLRYGTLFTPYEAGALDKGIAGIEGDGMALAVKAEGGVVNRFDADPEFKLLKALEAAV
jgi:hypothetical protein